MESATSLPVLLFSSIIFIPLMFFNILRGNVQQVVLLVTYLITYQQPFLRALISASLISGVDCFLFPGSFKKKKTMSSGSYLFQKL
jgi:hypothetical protein